MTYSRVLLCALIAAATCRAETTGFVVDQKRSHVAIAVESTLDSFVGSLDAYQLTVAGDSTAGVVRSARLEFSFWDVHTGNKDRDAAMNTWQDSAHQPNGLFVLDSIEDLKDGKGSAKGRLSFHGHEVPIVFPVRLTFGNGTCIVEGDAAVDTLQFGLPIIRKLAFLKVAPVVHVKFHIEAATAAAS